MHIIYDSVKMLVFETHCTCDVNDSLQNQWMPPILSYPSHPSSNALLVT